MFGSSRTVRDSDFHVMHHWLPSCEVSWTMSSPLRETSSQGLLHKGLVVSLPTCVTAGLLQINFEHSTKTIST